MLITKDRLRMLVPPVLAAAVTLVALAAVFAVYGIWPLGGNSIVWCDMEQQAVPILVQMKQLFLRGELSGYTLLDAGGMQFYGIFFFFLSNPLSFAVLLTDVPADQLVCGLTAVKLAAASFTAGIWLRYRVRTLAPCFQIILSVMYGLSGYGLFYYQNLMWLDIAVMFPLLMISLQILLKKQDPRPYCICLCIMMVLCFYLCYMIVLFTLIYVTVSVHYTVEEGERGRVLLRFWRASLLAACLTAVIWLPCFLQVMHSARSGGFVRKLTEQFMFDSIADKLCLLGCTCIIFAAPAGLHLFRPKTAGAARDRVLFFLLAVPLILDPVNMMWQTGSYQAFPLRWGMIPVLLLLTAAGRQLSERHAKPSPDGKTHPVFPALTTAAAIAVTGVMWYCSGEKIHAYVKTLWLDVPNTLLLIPVFLAASSAYLVLLTLRQHGGISRRQTAVLLSLLFAAEFSLHASSYLGAAANDDALFSQSAAAENPDQGDDPLLRMKLTRKYMHANTVGALGYPTLAHYTSMTREDFLRGVNHFGYSSYWMEVPSTGGTLLSDAFWHIGRQLGAEGDMPPWTERKQKLGAFTLAEYAPMLPSAVYLDAEPEEIASLPDGSRAEAQRFLAAELHLPADAVTEYAATSTSGLTLSEDEHGRTVCRLNHPGQSGQIRFSMFVPSQQALYFDLYSPRGTGITAPQDGAVTVRCNGRVLAKEYPEHNRNGLLYLGTADREYPVITLEVHKDFTCESFGVFGMSVPRTAEACSEAAGADAEYKNGVFTVHCSTDAPKTLLLSAAYHEGLRAWIDGEPAAVLCVNDCQAAVRIPAGECTVEFRSTVEGMSAGLLTGLLGIAAALLMHLIGRCRKKEPPAFPARAALLLARAAFVCIMLFIYCFPVIANFFGMPGNLDF